MLKLERKVISWVENHILCIFLLIITGVSLLFRISFRNYESHDYADFLLPWFNQLKENGGLQALNLDIGDYNVPYLTVIALLTYLPFNPMHLIKAFSILFDYVLAFGSYLLVNEFEGKRSIKGLIAYATVILMPTVIANSSAWSQCDSVYVAFLILSLYFLMKEKNTPSFILFGIAFGFKLQAVFLLPLFIFIYFSKKNFSVLTFIACMIIPNMIIAIPSIIAGKSPLTFITTYLGQMSYYDSLTLNMANLYLLVSWSAEISNLIIGVFILGMALVLLYIIYSKIRPDNKTIITLALWCVMWAVFLLPHMHERYLFLGDILSLIWVAVHKKKYYIFGCVELISFICYGPFLFDHVNLNFQYVSMLYLFLLIDFTIEMIKQLTASASHDKKPGTLLQSM